MLHHTIDSDYGILTVTPDGELTAEDFRKLTDVVDDYTADHEPLRALMILTENFPGWDSFGALFKHLKFIREHRDQVRKVAAVTDSGFLSVMPHVVDHFIKADVQHFPFAERERAFDWLRQ